MIHTGAPLGPRPTIRSILTPQRDGLPTPTGDNRWRREALCASGTGHWALFDSVKPADVEQAAEACQWCPVRRECAAHALQVINHHTDGVWAGVRVHGRYKAARADLEIIANQEPTP